jgi:hypothetical protein
VLWILGVIIFLLMMATAFMGYVLPWGQMSFWGATVITNLFSAIPLVGDADRHLAVGRLSVDNPTLNRFFSLHYLLPFVIVGVVILHVWALHVVGQNNPTGIDVKSNKDTVPFTPYARSRTASRWSCSSWCSRGSCSTSAELSRPRRQLHPGQPAGDAGAHRAGMVLPAVLRDPARDPRQARRRHRHVRLDRDPGVPAVARHLEGALGALPAALQAVLLDVRGWSASGSAISAPSRRGRLRDRGADPDLLLLPALPRHPAAARPAKARAHGPDYLFALLTGYGEPPAGFELLEGMNYNAAFPGHQIAMPQPLSDEAVEYTDGTPNDLRQLSRDVTTFLVWAAEPKLEARKRAGFQVMIYLVLLAGLLYFTTKKLWTGVEH